jgi:predicted peptidase
VIRARYLYGNATYNGLTIPYRYFVPEGYSAANKYAIVTFLHGIGERGSDNAQQLVRAPLILANDTVQSMYKFFVIAPQCPGNLEWQKNATLRAAVKQAQDDIIAKYPAIDGTNSRFIMGLSLGSFGTWTSVNQFSGVYKKAVPMAGGYTGITAANFRATQVWAFHSIDDTTVLYSTTNNTVNKLRADGQTVKFDDPKYGHVIDEFVLRNYPVIDWLFAGTGTGLPTNPGSNPSPSNNEPTSSSTPSASNSPSGSNNGPQSAPSNTPLNGGSLTNIAAEKTVTIMVAVGLSALVMF